MVMLEQNDHFTTWQWYRLRSYRRASFLVWEQLSVMKASVPRTEKIGRVEPYGCNIE